MSIISEMIKYLRLSEKALSESRKDLIKMVDRAVELYQQEQSDEV